MENERHYIPFEYPQYKRNQAHVIVHFSDGGRSRGMFYWNGGKPTFACYGTDVTKNVISWEYDNNRAVAASTAERK